MIPKPARTHENASAFVEFFGAEEEQRRLKENKNNKSINNLEICRQK